jgi:hypothetical protein
MKIHKLEILEYLFYNTKLVQMFKDFKQIKMMLFLNSNLYLMFQVSRSKTKKGMVQKKIKLSQNKFVLQKVCKFQTNSNYKLTYCKL